MLSQSKCCMAAVSLISLVHTSAAASIPQFYKPADSVPHSGTFMAWPTRNSIFGNGRGSRYDGEDLSETRKEIAKIAKAIAKYEPVQMLVRDPATVTDMRDPDNLKSAKKYIGNITNITLVVTPDTDSLWMRDTGPLFVFANGNTTVDNTWPPHADAGVGLKPIDTASNVVGLDLHFNQWGRKYPPSPDSYVAPKVCQAVDISCFIAPFVGEDGAIEVDGEGTLIATESSHLNPNRNPGITKAMLEEYFNRFLGINKTIWIPGAAGRPYTPSGVDTDGTLDDYKSAMSILNSTTDAQGRPFKVVPVYEPNPKEVYRKHYDPDGGVAVGYVNFHLVNGAVVMSSFGVDKVDNAAAEVIQAQFPERKVEQVPTWQLGLQGGGIHCSTQQYFV